MNVCSWQQHGKFSKEKRTLNWPGISVVGLGTFGAWFIAPSSLVDHYLEKTSCVL